MPQSGEPTMSTHLTLYYLYIYKWAVSRTDIAPLAVLHQIKSNQYSFNWQNTTTDTDAKVVCIIPKLPDGRRTE